MSWWQWVLIGIGGFLALCIVVTFFYAWQGWLHLRDEHFVLHGKRPYGKDKE